MRCSFMALATFCLTIGLIAADTSKAQTNRFTGNDQNVNRVIQLQSPVKPINQTTRSNRISTPLTNPEAMSFDEIKVPASLQKPGIPTVSLPTPPSVSKFSPQVTGNSRVLPNQQSGTMRQVSTVKTGQPVLTSQTSRLNNWISTTVQAPRYINVGKKAEFKIRVTNDSKDSASNVKLVAQLPQHAKLISSSTQPVKLENNSFEFSIPRLPGQDERVITLQVVPEKKLPLSMATYLKTENEARTTVSVRQPDLRISLDGPAQAIVGQNISHVLTITNVGDGPAENIRLDLDFPEQFQRLEQTSGSVISVIEAGKTSKINIKSLAVEPGQAEFKVSAQSETIKKRETTQGIRIIQPELRVSAIGPKINFVNRDGMYTIAIENSGEVDVTDVRVSLSVPQGMKVTTISRQANVDVTRGILTWTFPKILAKSSEKIQMKSLATGEGNQVCNILVSSKQTRDKELRLATKVTTRADMSVRILNQTGPVGVGGKAEFIVEVSNQGSRQAQDVAVQIELPPTLGTVSGNGSIQQFENGYLFTEPSVAPGKSVSFRFSVKGAKAGEHIVRSSLVTGESKQKLISEDTVYVYEVDETRVSESLSPVVPRR
ncbi:MAG: hypothetical protein AAF939_17545 [Planctomycetota bacterium]